MIKDMRKIVEDGYDNGEYLNAFRRDGKLTAFQENFLKELTQTLVPNSKILDFGCGSGIPFDGYLIDKGFKITGIDISQKHIQQARENFPEAKFVKRDFSETSFEETFNAIVSFYALFHIPRDEHKDIFKKMYDLLDTNGVILVTLGTSDSEYGEEDSWFGSPKMAWSSYAPDLYVEMVKDLGFQILKTNYEGKPGEDEYHFWLLAKKT